MPRYATPNQYAQLCGLSRQAIHQRIAQHKLALSRVYTPIGYRNLIDTEAYPPLPAQPPGRKPGTKNKPRTELPSQP